MLNQKLISFLVLIIMVGCIPPDYMGMPKVLFKSETGWVRNYESTQNRNKIKIRGYCMPSRGLKIKIQLAIENNTGVEFSISESDIKVHCNSFKIVDYYESAEKNNYYWINIESIESYEIVDDKIRSNQFDETCSISIENTDNSVIFFKFKLEK